MRSIAFILSFFVTFTITLQISYLKDRELLCLIISCIAGFAVTATSKEKILDFSKVTINWLIYAFALGFVYAMIKFYTKYYFLGHDISSSKEASLQTLIETLVFIVLIIPLLEEFFFRGILFDDIRGKLGSKAAILITSIFFIALHINNFNINPIYESIFLMLPGVFLYVYLKTKTNNFLVSYLAHLTHNLTVFILLLFL